MAKLLIDKKITGLESSWELYKGSRVREHIMEKCGAFYRPDRREADNAYHLKGFASLETRDIWIRYNSKEDSEIEASLELIELGINNRDAIDALVLVDTSLGGNTEVINSAELYTGSNLENIVSTDNRLLLLFRFVSLEYNPVTESTRDTGESATLYVQSRASDNEDWRTLGTVSIPSLPYESSLYTLVDLSSIVPSGVSLLKCYAVGLVSGYMTSPILFASVTKTELKISIGTQWWVPVTSDVMNLSYYVQGAVAKTLHVRISGEGGTGIRAIDIPLGTAIYVESPRTVLVSDSSSDTVQVMTHGLHTIDAWVTVDGSNVESEHIISKIMVVDLQNPSNDIIFVVNDVPNTIDNYTLTKLFGYGIYNPNALVTRVTFTITDYSGETIYLTSTEDIRNGNEGAYNNMLEIESLENSIDVYVHVYDEGGNELIDPISFTVDNSENFSPTSGADFILNPKTRSNNEVNPATIINAANGDTVPSEFINFGFASDGWILNERGVKVLRVSANSFLNILFEPYTLFMGTGNQTASLTMEFDIETRNIIDENTPILKVCSYQNDMPLGFELKPLEAVYMTSALLTRRDLDIMFQEDERTHIAVNIVYNLGALGINYIRLFVNGVINREMIYRTNDTFVGYVDGVKTSQGIRIGSTGADIDIYGIKVYKKSLSATNIRQDYMASMATTAEKLKFRDANDILNDLGNISYSKAYDKYSTILWTGTLPYYLNSTKLNGDVKIHIVEREYNTLSQRWEYTVDKAHSGEMKDVQLKGQGTSSMGYYKWNGLFKTSYEDSNGNEVKTNWIDENGDEHGAKYQLTNDTPPATKLVWKINWASPQLSHKLGSCALYTDLWRRVVGGNSVTNYTPDGGATYPYSNVRVSVILKPFMLFQRATEDSEPVFYGLVTFGPGKADKPTFGYIKNLFPDLTMIEGSDNGKPLTEHRVPWMEDEVEFDGEEVYSYNGEKSWELDLGKANIVNTYFVPAFNFIFLHNTNIRPFIGTYELLILSASVNIGTHYWVTQDSELGSRYNLYRWDFLTQTWVNASASKTNGEYDVLNLSTLLSYIPSGNNWEVINGEFIARRATDFKAHIGDYFVVNDLLYTMCFCKFIAASDNRCKNTYLYCDPVTHKIGFMQDDLDTIFSTDNVGRKNKPYYVEEHDLDQNNSNYWNGAENVLYNAVEASMKDELISTMYSMLQAMKDLGNGSIKACMDKYYFSVQEYIPAVAYNEVARLLYEEASQIYGTLYQNATNPITLSLGDLLLAEKQWVNRRIIYMSSYASFGEFNSRDQVGGDGALVFRSILSTSGTSPVYNFTLTPALWLYPSVAVGTTSFYGRDRVPAGTPYVIENLGADGNTNIYLRGINYYSSIGNFSGISLGEAFGLSGARLAEFSAASNDPSNIQFRPTSMTVSADLVRTFSVNGISTLVGNLDLSALTKVQTIDLRGTSLSGVVLPLTNTLQEIYLPSTITSLSLENLPNLTTLLFEGTSNLQSLSIGNNVSNSIDVPAIILSLRSDGTQLAHLELRNISWTNTNINVISYIANVTDALVTGTILGISGSVTFDIKQALVAKFGDIDDANNPLYLTYDMRYINSMVLTGPTYLDLVGEDYRLSLSVDPATGNNVQSIQWGISTQNYATINSSTGVIHVNRIGTEELAPSATVTVTMTLSGGSALTLTKEVRFYTHTAQLGDIVFADGSVSDINDSTKTAIGVCFYIDEFVRLMVSVNTIVTTPWGLYNNASNGYAGVTLSDGTDAYNVPGLSDITINGTDYVTDAKYLNLDGTFKSFAANSAAGDIGSKRLTEILWTNYQSYFSGIGYNKLDYVPTGMLNTAAIITHRNKVLQDENVNLDIPTASNTYTEWRNLLVLMLEVNSERNSTNAMQLYFPAASYCYAYEPTVKPGETLLNKFKAHHWWLPSEGELARINFYKLHGSSTEANDSNAIFASAFESGALAWFSGNVHWSSTEFSATYAWVMRFSDGYVGNGYGHDTYKYYSYEVRAVAAF